MRKLTCLLLALLLMLTACTSGGETTEPTRTTETIQNVTEPAETTAPSSEETKSPIKPLPGETDGILLPYANPGKARVSYEGNRSYVRYITSVAELPEEEVLAVYDEAFFEHSALLLVVETVSSGSIRVEMGDIFLSGDTARVTLKREMSGDVGTADMATWMLWAEVEKGLSCGWELDGDNEKLPGSSKY